MCVFMCAHVCVCLCAGVGCIYHQLISSFLQQFEAWQEGMQEYEQKVVRGVKQELKSYMSSVESLLPSKAELSKATTSTKESTSSTNMESSNDEAVIASVVAACNRVLKSNADESVRVITAIAALLKSYNEYITTLMGVSDGCAL